MKFLKSRWLQDCRTDPSTEGIAESQRRAQAREARLYADLIPLMNDTKWREVLVTIARREIWFQLQLVGWQRDAFTQLIAPVHPGFFERTPQGFVDGVHTSGFFFREIWRVRCPFVVPGQLVRSIHDRRQDIAGLMEALGTLGQLPLAESESCIEIRGYDESGKVHDG
jgi:hypothetical protein